MNEENLSSLSLLAFVRAILGAWKFIFVIVAFVTLCFVVVAYFFVPVKHYSEARIIGDFSEKISTPIGEYRFLSNNIEDYISLLNDERVFRKTLSEFKHTDSSLVKVDFKTQKSPSGAVVVLYALTSDLNLKLDDFLVHYFANFLDLLNAQTTKKYKKQILKTNELEISFLKENIVSLKDIITAHKEILDSLERSFGKRNIATHNQLIFSEVLDDVNLLSIQSSLAQKKIRLEEAKLKLIKLERMNSMLDMELNEYIENSNVFSAEIESFNLFDAHIRIATSPTIPKTKLNRITFIIIGLALGLIMALAIVYFKTIRKLYL
jgi:capsular polysaccharide biosynthesis protein